MESYDDEGEKESGKTFPTLPKPKTGRGNIQFAAETATLTGQSKRRKEVWGALHPDPSPDYSLESYDGDGEEIQPRQIVAPEIGYKKPPPQTKGFAASTAEVTGENVRQIQRSLARAEAIGPDLLRLTGTSLARACG